MNKIVLIINLLLAMNFMSAQTKDFFVVPTNNALAIYLTFSPGPNTVYDVYRKTDTGYVKINENSIRVALDTEEAKVKLAKEWDMLENTFNTDNPVDILLSIKRNDFTASVLSLVSANIAETSGRLVWDSKQSGNQNYKIIFYSISGVKKDSLEKTVSTDFRLPRTPGNLTAENVNNQINLKWEYPKWNGDFSDLGFSYNIYRKKDAGDFKKINDNIIIRDDQNTPNYDDVYLSIGSEYSYYVTVSDPAGNESKPSNTINIKMKDVVAPGIVNGLRAVSEIEGILFAWKMSPELDVKGYNIYRSKMATGENLKLNKELIKFDSPFFVDSTAALNIQSFYKITAVDSSGNESKMSNAFASTRKDMVIPSVPANVRAESISGFVKLTWSKSDEKDIRGFLIYRGLDSSIVARISEPIKQTAFIDSGYNKIGFNFGATVHYFISTIDSSKNESEKVYLTVKVPDVQAPILPTNFRIENKNGNFAEIAANPSASNDAAKYFIYKKGIDGNQKLFREMDDAPFTLRDSNVVKGHSYYYSISVIDTAGNKSNLSEETEIFIRDYNPPPIPKNIQIKLTNNEINLTWSEVNDFDLLGYNIYRSNMPSGTYKKLNKKPVADPGFVDSTGNKDMFYRIKSVDTSGNESNYERNVAVK